MSQPPPTPNDSKPVWDCVIDDMKARDRMGRANYGTPLQAGNGRDPLQDWYEELLDASAYAKQLMIEVAKQRGEVGRVMYHLRTNSESPVITSPAYYKMLYDRLAEVGFKEHGGPDPA